MASTDPFDLAALKVLDQDLKGKVALVTGATKGIGRSIALNLALRGSSILGTCSSPQTLHLFDTLSHTISSLYTSSPHEKPPYIHCIPANITQIPSVNQITSYLQAKNLKLSIIVLNASCNERPKLGDAPHDQISRILSANIHWPYALIDSLVSLDLLLPHSRIVHISSDRARDPIPGSALYSATKAAIESLVRSWAIEIPIKYPGTTVNSVSVGLTDTPLFRSFPEEAQEAARRERLPKVRVVEGGRMGRSEDVGEVVGWLVGGGSKWVTGSVVAGNGGAAFIG